MTSGMSYGPPEQPSDSAYDPNPDGYAQAAPQQWGSAPNYQGYQDYEDYQGYQGYQGYPGYGPGPVQTPYPGFGPYPGYGYPAAIAPPGKPGPATGAGVLGYVLGGLLIVAAVYLFLVSSYVSDFNDFFGADNGSIATELLLDGLVDLAAAGLLIGGAVALLGRRELGRTLLSVGAAVCIADAIYWLARIGVAAVVVAVVLGAVAVVALCLVWTGGVTRWLRGYAAQPPLPYGY